MTTLLKFIGALILIPAGWVWKAVVGVNLWAWFVVPLGVPAVGLAHALGLTLIGWFFTTGLDMTKGADDNKYLVRWTAMQIAIGVVWLFGYIFHSFMPTVIVVTSTPGMAWLIGV